MKAHKTKNTKNKELTQKRLKEVLRYEDGQFFWKESKGPARKDNKAGTTRNDGYVLIKIDYVRYYAHRLVWLYHYGKFPDNEIDHIDGDRGNNNIDNLRDVDHLENGKNQRKSTKNRSGVVGVLWDKAKSKWRSYITHNKKRIDLGHFDDFKQAVAVRKKAEVKYNYHPNHGK